MAVWTEPPNESPDKAMRVETHEAILQKYPSRNSACSPWANLLAGHSRRLVLDACCVLATIGDKCVDVDNVDSLAPVEEGEAVERVVRESMYPRERAY